MEWNHKNPLQWDWENLGFLSGKEREISNSTEISDWRVGGGAISNGSMHSPGSGTCSGSELLNGSSKNSISTSVGSLIDIGNVISEVNLEAAEGNLMDQIKNQNKEMTQGEDNRISPLIAGCICTGEPPIGLKLGKRTYFENLRSTNFKNSSSVNITPPAASVKRSRESHQTIQHSYCQVEGCNIDLTAAKDYHRKHRVCASHSKSPRVIVSGHERRFCQQCSRFHDLSEFDQKKRSCRRRLFDHNARRRKPQPETISFKPSRLHPEFYDDGQQMNFYLNLAPLNHVKQPSPASSLWDHSPGFSPSMTKGSWIKQTKTGADGQLHLPVMDFSHAANASRDDFNIIMPFKLAATEVLNQGQEASVSASDFNGAPDLHRALSLLSNDAWCPPSAVQSGMIHLACADPIAASQSPIARAVNSAPECWQDYHSLAEQALTFSLYGNENQIPELHLSKASLEEGPLFEANQLFSKPDGHFLESKT